MDIHGKNVLGAELSATGKQTFQGYNPRAGTPTRDTFHEAGNQEIHLAAELAAQAAEMLQNLSAQDTAGLLDAIREEILALGDSLIEKADEESALGMDRLRGERDRTVNQLKLFADLVREGSWVDARIDTPQKDRKPLPKPDLRRMLRPIGPVAVFGASNFPLAFSVAGGDTASALAARNPVIVKAHPSHPGTSELVAGAIARAVKRCSLPAGTFSMVHGMRPEVSVALISHPAIRAVAFTGSGRAGRALFDAAAKRPEPIPVFAEMGSVNPVFLLPSALQTQNTAEGLLKSVTLGVGQFCTCPGLAFGAKSPAWDQFVSQLQKQVRESSPGSMLNPNIAGNFAASFEKAAGVAGLQQETSTRPPESSRTEGRPGVLAAEAGTWLEHPELREEIFGPATIVVACQDEQEMLACARALEGSLTATIHGTVEELSEHAELVNILQRKAGRLLFNGYPTGVEVGFAMQHGGPYPATTDSRFTSVGTAAIYRFARPVCFQNFPDAALPEELQSSNPQGIWRQVDGKLTNDPLALA